MKKRFFISFKYKLGLVMSALVSLVVLLLGMNLYFNIKRIIEEQYRLKNIEVNSTNYYALHDSLEKMTLFIIIALIIFIIISIVLGSILANLVSKPVQEMIRGTEEISNGNFNYKINIKSHDEFRVLGKNFNSMVHHIKKLIEARNHSEEELRIKNNEILQQKEEINALYEQTAAMNEELEYLLSENHRNYFATVKALVNSIEAKDKYTRGHCERVMEYSVKIGEALDLEQSEINNLRYAALLHDVGKIGVPSKVINKCAKLTDEEMEIIKIHPKLGYDILKDVSFLDSAREAILHHHERIDGKGYPEGLSGKEISLLARILAIADAFDAMTTGRSYRTIPFAKKIALEQLIKNKNTQFDPEIVDVFIMLIEKENIKNLQQEII